MACRIKNNIGYEPDGVTISKLYKDALEYTSNNTREALEIFATSLTSDFINAGIEPTLENTLKYIEYYNKEYSAPLTGKEKSDIIRATINNPTFINDFIEVFKNEQGRFHIDTTKMEKMFTQSEIRNMDYKEVRKVWYKLQKLEDYSELTTDIVPMFLIKDTTVVNSVGKHPYLNPDEVYQTFAEIFSGAITREEFNYRMENSENDFYMEMLVSDEYLQQQVFEEFSTKKSEVEYVDSVYTGELEKKTYGDTAVTLLHTFDVNSDKSSLLSEIDYLLSLDVSVYQDAQVEIQDLLHRVEDYATNIGIAMPRFSEVFKSKTFGQNAEFLNSLAEFLNDVNNIEEFAQQYDTYYNTEPTTKLSIKPNNFIDTINVETTKSENELYGQYSLVKVNGTSYVKVEKKPFEELLDDYYNSTAVPPIENYSKEVQEEESSKQNLVNYIDSHLKGYTQDMADIDTARSIILYKLYNNIPLTPETTTPNINVEYNIWEQRANFDMETFLSDIYQEIINKRLPLVFTQNGLALTHRGEYTLQELRDKLSPEMLNQLTIYAGLTKNQELYELVNIMEIENVPNLPQEFLRNFYEENPTALEEYTGNYGSIENGITVRTEIPQDFLRIGDNIYEKVAPTQYNLINTESGTVVEDNNVTFESTVPVINTPTNLREDITQC